MSKIIHRIVSFVLACFALFFCCTGAALASEDISLSEDSVILIDNNQPEVQENAISEEIIISFADSDAESINIAEENSEESEADKELPSEIADDSFSSQTFESEENSPPAGQTSEAPDSSASIVETEIGDTDELAVLAASSSSPHGCGYEQIDFRGMCRTNYQMIKTIYMDSSSSGWGNAYAAAATFWVNKVREYGEWDYKRTEKYGPAARTFCSYYDGAYHDITSEHMGNYNYGYTGSYLFTLETLLNASFVVSKCDISDVYTDWPSICAGYNAAQAEQNNIHPVSRWILFQGDYYYFDSDGSIAIGWKKIAGNWYYFSSTGIMQTGWIKINGTWYYLNSSGVMQTGWVKYNDKWYYLDSSGAMLTGWQQIGSTYYYFESAGDWSGWIIYGGYHYYRDPTTSEVYTKGWLKYNGYWYYLNTTTGKIVTGWLQYDGGYYYLSPSNGKMVTGWLKYNSYWYYMSSSGKMYASQWLKYNGYWYYFKSNGKMAASTTLTIGGTRYTFDSSGRMVT